MPLGPPFRVERRDVVRRVFIALEESLGRHVFVARLAGFRANVERRIGGPLVGFRLTGRLLFGSCLLSPTLANQQRHAHESGEKQQKPGPGEFRSHAHVHTPNPVIRSRRQASRDKYSDSYGPFGCDRHHSPRGFWHSRKEKLAADDKEVPISLTETRPGLTGSLQL